VAALDALPADQRAVLSLVLTRGQTYDEIASMLSIDRAAVRDRARAALERLGPATEVDVAQRSLLTDYLLGQLPDAVADQTRETLSRSAAEREWASAVATELAPIARSPLPEIVPPEPPESVQPVPARSDPVDADDDEKPGPPSSRRGGAILLAVLAVVVVAAVALVIHLVAGGSSSPGVADTITSSGTTAQTGSNTTAGTTTTPTVKVLSRLVLLPPTPDSAHRAAGVAEIVSERSETGIVLVTRGLAPNTKHDAYAVWLTGKGGKSAFVGFVSKLVGTDGKLTADGILPADAASYATVLLTLETQQQPHTPGRIVLEGPFSLER
jgi:Sigma-70, region 4